MRPRRVAPSPPSRQCYSPTTERQEAASLFPPLLSVFGPPVREVKYRDRHKRTFHETGTEKDCKATGGRPHVFFDDARTAGAVVRRRPVYEPADADPPRRPRQTGLLAIVSVMATILRRSVSPGSFAKAVSILTA